MASANDAARCMLWEHMDQPAIALSPDEKNLFLVRTLGRNGEVLPYERTSNSSFKSLSSVIYNNCWNAAFQSSAKWNIIAGKDVILTSFSSTSTGGNIFLMNATNKSHLTNFARIDGNTMNHYLIPAVAMTQDEKTVIYINDTSFRGGKNQLLNIVTLSDNGVVNYTLSNYQIPALTRSNRFSIIKASKNGNFAFYVNCELLIYNIRDHQSPILESIYDLNISRVYAFTLSKNEQTLYLFGLNIANNKTLQILDISDVKSPKLLSYILISQSSESTDSIELSPDNRMLFLGFSDGLLMIDVQTPSQPILFGYNYFVNEMNAFKFANNGSLFYTVSALGLTAFDITSQYMLSIRNSDFKVGGSYQVSLNV
ncbi:MAG: hypothetical protein EOP48_30030, partial [Sphingobacteriales bacterium]